MKKVFLMIAMLLIVCLVHVQRQESVTAGDTTVQVSTELNEGLEEVSSASYALGLGAPALAGCASWDIKENCCPAYCAAKRGSNWSKADKIFRGCMLGLGCDKNKVKNASGFIHCGTCK